MSWTATTASVAGTSHDRKGVPCQDANDALSIAQTLILAAADGAGCAEHAQEGARTAASAAISYLAGVVSRHKRPPYWKTALRSLVTHCRKRLQDLAAQHGIAVHDFATTLLVAVITPSHVAVLQIGDGSVVAYYDDQTLCVLTTQQVREYANEVVFLISDEYEEELRITVRPARGLRGIALVTDGVESLCVNRSTNRAHPGFFVPLFASATNLSRADLAAFLSSPGVCERTDDDKTIVIATRT